MGWLEEAHAIAAEEEIFLEGGGTKGHERQRKLGRLSVRERLNLLLDDSSEHFEMGLWAAWKMYAEWGDLPAAGVITTIGRVSGRQVMVIANDATVKAGALFPQSVKKVLRAQKIAFENRLPIIYLVDSSGVFLPLQDEIFPDEDDFGRIFRNNAIFSSAGIPQYAAIMGNCIAGGGYLPVLCDTLLMTEGSGLYLAGPALVKAAIGQVVDTETLGGAKMHAQISGTVDFREPDDPSCLKKLRSLVSMLPKETVEINRKTVSEKDPAAIYDVDQLHPRGDYDVRDLLKYIIDKDSFEEYKAEFGPTLVCGYARLGGVPVGIVASQRKQVHTGRGEVQVGGVIYADSADKAARFVMDCNQIHLPILFFQDVVGFMVGKEAEASGIIRSGAKLVNALSNSIVPKITVVLGHSFGAGNYALCGKAYDPRFIVAWPNATYAVMGADQAADTLYHLEEQTALKKGEHWDEQEADKHHAEVRQKYQKQMNIRYGAARGWVDAIIAPHRTREVLLHLLEISMRHPTISSHFHTGVIQV